MKSHWGYVPTSGMQRERNKENLQIFGLDPYSVRCNPAVSKDKSVFAVYTLLQIKLDSHICLYVEYVGIKSQKPVGGKNEGWWERATELTFLPFVSRMFSHVCTDPRNYPVKIISPFLKRDDSGE